MNNLLDRTDLIQDWLATNGPTYLLRFCGAVLVFILGRWLAGLLSKWFSVAMRRSHVDETLVRFFGHCVYIVVIVVVVLASLDMVGVQTTSIVAMIGAAGLAIGLAMQGSLANFAAGVLIIFFRPFRVGDFITAADASGVVEEIGIFTTQLRNADGRTIIVPNSRVTGGNIINYMSHDARRLELTVTVSLTDDPGVAKAAIERAVKDVPQVLPEPKAIVGINRFVDLGMEFAICPWVNFRDEYAAKFALNEAILRELDAAGCTVSSPALTWLNGFDQAKTLKKGRATGQSSALASSAR